MGHINIVVGVSVRTKQTLSSRRGVVVGVASWVGGKEEVGHVVGGGVATGGGPVR